MTRLASYAELIDQVVTTPPDSDVWLDADRRSMWAHAVALELTYSGICCSNTLRALEDLFETCARVADAVTRSAAVHFHPPESYLTADEIWCAQTWHEAVLLNSISKASARALEEWCERLSDAAEQMVATIEQRRQVARSCARLTSLAADFTASAMPTRT